MGRKKDFNTLSKEEQLNERKQIYKRWALSYEEGKEMYRVEAEIRKSYNLTKDEMQELKKKDKWDKRLEKELSTGKYKKKIRKGIKENIPSDNQEAIKDINQLLDEADIPDRWKIFIMYYLHSYNITYAAQKAGYTSGANCSAGFKALQDPRVKKLMKQIKEIMYTDIYITGKIF
jgi:hypothetical protein